jgi:DMSO/TMAO reductase YedYZ heme-binding membrane subunit
LLAAVAAALAVVIGFLFVFTDMVLGTADSFDVALTANYLPVITSNLIAAVILTPLLVAAWEPIRNSMGR